MARVDRDDLNDLVADRDPVVLAFFGLTKATDDELNSWDAYDLEDDRLPRIKDIQKDFEPESPYDVGWDLHVVFVDPNE